MNDKKQELAKKKALLEEFKKRKIEREKQKVKQTLILMMLKCYIIYLFCDYRSYWMIVLLTRTWN
jgi:hypothetical protein